MPMIDTNIVQHCIPTDPTMKLVKQKLRRMKPEWILKIKEEVEKQYNAGFLRVVNYSEWLDNVVLVPKKDGKVRMCVDFQDLNKASPKDDLPLPHIDVLVDKIAGHALLSFMDEFLGYNQIKIALEDMEKTSFIIPWGTNCYKVMTFGLKNAGATYQHPATTLLHDLIHKEVEVYVDDMIVKSKDHAGHMPALSKFFERIWNVTQKSIKGRVIADNLAHCSPEEAEEIQGDFSDEDIMGIEVESWKMYFNRATNQNGSGIGVLIISPKGTHIPFSGRLNFLATNNAIEYKAYIMGLRAALSLGVKELEVYGDSTLIISQFQNKRKIKEERLVPYHECLQKWASKFNKVQYQYVPRMKNQIVDALATMASMMDRPKEDETRPIVLEHKEEPANYCMTIEKDEEKNGEGEWYSDILQYLKDGTYPPSPDKND
ncbi:uncharacterized protein LOC142628249 [Castanea sativa]|uniref:uncharacterized protein LOC142628249 n=1 Tax=Castanea sativa TaxID=21020 RepID=UPI003F65491E